MDLPHFVRSIDISGSIEAKFIEYLTSESFAMGMLSKSFSEGVLDIDGLADKPLRKRWTYPGTRFVAVQSGKGDGYTVKVFSDIDERVETNSLPLIGTVKVGLTFRVEPLHASE